MVNTDAKREAAEMANVRRSLADLFRPKRARYWVDLLLTVATMWGAILLGSAPERGPFAMALCFSAAFCAAHRGAMFMHEITHLANGAVPGIKLAWNALLGVPLLMPSYVYERMHLDHHRLDVYGTAHDPEYAPHARMSAWQTLAMSASGLVLPIALVARWLLLAPLALLSRRLRAFVEAHADALTGNLSYRPRPLKDSARRVARISEAACALWGWLLVVGLATEQVSARIVIFTGCVFVMVTALNQLRSLASHRYENDGATMTQFGQLLDSVNIPKLTLAAALLLPVGARFHALHHWCPAIPYHALDEAHARLARALPEAVGYGRTCEPGIVAAVTSLLEKGNAFARRREVAS